MELAWSSVRECRSTHQVSAHRGMLSANRDRPHLAIVEDGFDVVPVRVENVRTVVAGVVLTAFSRCTVASVSRRHCSSVECVDLFARRSGERDVETARHRFTRLWRGDREITPLHERITNVRVDEAERSEHSVAGQ